MLEFEFVSVSHPDEIKDRKKQAKLRQHAIRNGIQKSKAERVKKNGVFVPIEVDGRTRQPVKRSPPKADSLTTAPSVSLLDPFNTLCGCPERLRNLMRHPPKQIEPSGLPFSQGMETIFQGALTDPSLFHALSLVLSHAANNDLHSVELLTHRGELLSGIRVNIKGLDGRPQVSTLTAMLLLISYEYRMDGTNCTTIAAHIRGVQAIMKQCKARNAALIDEVQRALFWQDLLSCLMAGTPRFLSHRDFHDFQSPRNVNRLSHWEVPVGFRSNVAQWPGEFALVLQDLNSLCWVVDSQCNAGDDPLDMFPVDNNQANLESRLIDLLRECKTSKLEVDPWYEACILAAFLCAYKLSAGIWIGCCIPEMCINQIVLLVTKVPRASRWLPTPDLLKWLLLVSGGMTEREQFRTPIAQLIRELPPGRPEYSGQAWEMLKSSLKTFIWCEHTMERKVHRFWKEVHQKTPELDNSRAISWDSSESLSSTSRSTDTEI